MKAITRNNQQQTKLLWLTTIVAIIGYICFMLLYPVNARADLRGDMKTVIEKHGPGEEVAVYGRMIPGSALAEWKKAKSALRDARILLRKAIGRAKMMDQVPEWAVRLSGRLDALTEDFNTLSKSNLLEHEDLEAGNRALAEVLMKLSMELSKFHGELLDLEKELTKKMNRDEGWSFGLAAYGSAEYATGKQEVLPIGGVGLMASFRKERMSLDLLIGAGVGVVGHTSVSWTFIPSLQFQLENKKLSVGPAMVLSQDLGNMEGADRLVWQAGIKLKTALYNTMNLWLVPSFGVQGERGHGASDPTYSPNVGITLGMDWTILK